jgi:hypothetical protein
VLPATVLAAKVTVAVGGTVSVAVPPVTTKSSTEKLLPTLSLNTKVKVVLPATVLAAKVTVAVGGTVSVAAPPPHALINKEAARAQAERLKVFAK